MIKIKSLVFFLAICFGIFINSHIALGACTIMTVCNETNYNRNDLGCCTSSSEEGACQKVSGYYVCVAKTGSTDGCGGKCTSEQNCEKNSGDGKYYCVGKSSGYDSNSCGGKCTSEQNCEKNSGDGKYYCVGKSATNSLTTVEFTNPLKYDTVQGLATNILDTLRTIIVVLSIIFIILGGIFYIVSAGNEKMMKLAKGSITASMIGLAIGIAAPSFLKEIYAIMGGNGTGITEPAGLSLTQIALNFLNFLLSIVGILALIMLIIGGITFLTSAGDEDRYKTGKKIVTYAVIGIAVSLAALVIVKQIANLLK